MPLALRDTMESLINLVKSSKRLVGLRQVLKGLIADTLRCVVVADDSDDFVKKTISEAVKGKAVQVLTCQSKMELGELCSIDVACAVVGLLK